MKKINLRFLVPLAVTTLLSWTAWAQTRLYQIYTNGITTPTIEATATKVTINGNLVVNGNL